MSRGGVRVAKSAGFCFGVDRAVRSTRELITNNSDGARVYTVGHLIHNPQLISELEKSGVGSIDAGDIDAIAKSCADGAHAVVVIRAHGVEKELCEKLEDYSSRISGFSYLDCTCPYVKKIHRIVDKHTDADTRLIVIGAASHPEVKGIVSYAHGPYSVFTSSEQLAEQKFNEKRIVMVAQTTQSLSEWKKCQEIIQNLYTNAKIFDTICSVTENRQKETAELCRSVDVMLIIGGRESSNTNKLYRISRQGCPDTFFIEKKEDLPLNMIKPGTTVGIAAGASTPGGIIKEVETIMSEKIAEMEGENFAELLEQSLKTLHTGETVKGVITSISPNEIFVDLGTKTTGVISTEELSDDASFNPADKYKVGDEIEAVVIKVSDNDGIATLSRKRIERRENWSSIVDAYNNGTVLEGKVVDVVKGGLIILLNAVRVFVPASQSGLPKDADLSALRGTVQKVKIIDLDEGRNRAVASIRVVAREQKKAQEEEFWANVEEGKRYTGTVKSLKSYGAFVDLGGVNGMVHITELSWSRIKHPSEVVKEGDVIEVYVKSFDRETGRISLGYKAAEDDPWLLFTNKYSVGDTVNVKILSLLPFGAFAEILPGTDGLIHISQIADRKIAKPSEVLSIGDRVDVKITEIDDENRKVSLSIRALLEDTEKKADEEAEEYINSEEN